MRKKVCLLCICGTLLFSGCDRIADSFDSKQSSEVNIESNSEDANTTSDQGEEENQGNQIQESYEQIMKMIEDFNSNFTNLYTNELLSESGDLKINKGTMNFQSTEGNEAIQFLDNQSKVIRYEVSVYGETGKAEYNFYILNDDMTLVTTLTSVYSSPNLMLGGDDVLYSEQEKYLIKDSVTYAIDDVNESIVEKVIDDETVTMTVEELDNSFTLENNNN
ncbi:MAG TPA: hypothetical protein VHQ24_10970 [Lachnospiraceae bacterium]|nr:hypothetical protein [Lachnospiraceae bacterium]